MASSGFAFQAVNSLGGAYVQSKAMRAQGRYEQDAANTNAQSLDYQAEDTVKAGEAAASRKQQQVTQVQGSQKAVLAANGVDVNSEGARNALDETAVVGEADIAQIKTNAWREAYGLKSEATNLRTQGAVAANTAKYAARNTMITGGLNAASYTAQSYGAKKAKETK